MAASPPWRHGARADDLPRGAIIGAAKVVEISDSFDSEWFGGDWGLRLEGAYAVEPIPAPGALGYFEWQEGGSLSPPVPWMRRYNRPSGDHLTANLFGDLPPAPRDLPERPGRKGSSRS